MMLIAKLQKKFCTFQVVNYFTEYQIKPSSMHEEKDRNEMEIYIIPGSQQG